MKTKVKRNIAAAAVSVLVLLAALIWAACSSAVNKPALAMEAGSDLPALAAVQSDYDDGYTGDINSPRSLSSDEIRAYIDSFNLNSVDNCYRNTLCSFSKDYGGSYGTATFSTDVNYFVFCDIPGNEGVPADNSVMFGGGVVPSSDSFDPDNIQSNTIGVHPKVERTVTCNTWSNVDLYRPVAYSVAYLNWGERPYKEGSVDNSLCSIVYARAGEESESVPCYLPYGYLAGTGEYPWSNTYYVVIQIHFVGVNVLPPEPTKEGYSFAGWYYGTDEEHEAKGGSCIPYDGEPITGDTDLHAHFNVLKCKVTLDPGDGTSATSLTVDWGTVLSGEQLAAPKERTGYDFVGWQLDGEIYDGEPVKSDIKLVAQWERAHCKVTFYVDGEVYMETDVLYGARLDTVMSSERGLENYTVRSIAGDEMEIEDPFLLLGETAVSVDYDGTGATAADKLRENWPAVLGGVLGGIVLVSIIGALAGDKRRRSGR